MHYFTFKSMEIFKEGAARFSFSKHPECLKSSQKKGLLCGK